MRRHAMLAVACTAALGALGAAPAHAGTASGHLGGLGPVGALQFHAADGEANDVTISLSPDGWVVEDAGAPLAAGEHCRSLDDHRALCFADEIAHPLLIDAHVELGDEDDALDVAVAMPDMVLAFGGAGDDRIRTGPSPAAVEGGAGDDAISTGPGADVVYGDEQSEDAFALSRAPGGDDELRSGGGDDFAEGGAGADRIAGGAGDDSMSGGRGDDVLRGGAGADAIDGDLLCDGSGACSAFTDWLGEDVVAGGAGPDVLSGRTGADRLFGGDGDDRFRLVDEPPDHPFSVRAPLPDVAVCGDGVDAVEADAIDAASLDCESSG